MVQIILDPPSIQETARAQTEGFNQGTMYHIHASTPVNTCDFSICQWNGKFEFKTTSLRGNKKSCTHSPPWDIYAKYIGCNFFKC
jgi:hypothetical protein